MSRQTLPPGHTPIALCRLTSPAGRLTADFVPALGGQMTSLRMRDGGAMRELLYRGGDLRPTTGWGGRAPTLWPVIGRTYRPGPPPSAAEHRSVPLGWEYDGAIYPMPHHGFARSLHWRVEGISPARLSMVLEDGPATRCHYPFGFSLRLDAAVDDQGVRLTYRIVAAAKNPAAMPFTIGNHITFRTPLREGTPLEAITLRSNATRRRLLDAIGRPSGIEVADLRFRAPFRVADLAPLDVIVLDGFHDGPAGASLSEESGLQLSVFHTVTGPRGDAPLLLTVWGDPPGGYLSLEPWLGLPNALSSGTGRVVLAPGAALAWDVSVSVLSGRDRSTVYGAQAVF